MGAFPNDAGPAYSYWGHMHAGVWYNVQSNGAAAVIAAVADTAPCHAGRPRTFPRARTLFGTRIAAPVIRIYRNALNGFSVISLDGPKITETFYDEDGGVAYPRAAATRPVLSAPLLSVVRAAAFQQKSQLDSALAESRLTVRIFDGTRQPISSDVRILMTITDGNENQRYRDYLLSGTAFQLPFFDNLGDNYTLIAFADRYSQAGFTPIKCSPEVPQTVDIMLLPKMPGSASPARSGTSLLSVNRYCTQSCAWRGKPRRGRRPIFRIDGRRAPVLACLFNIATAMSSIALPVGNPLQYFKEVIWDNTMAQDRFYGWATPRFTIKFGWQQKGRSRAKLASRHFTPGRRTVTSRFNSVKRTSSSRSMRTTRSSSMASTASDGTGHRLLQGPRRPHIAGGYFQWLEREFDRPAAGLCAA